MRRLLPVSGVLAALTLTGALATAMAATPAQAGPLVPVTGIASGQTVAGEYIVTTRPGAATAQRAGVAPTHVYTSALTGFAARLAAAQLRAVQRDPDVLMIERNAVAHALTTQTPTPNWGIDRIDQRTLPLTNSYTYFATGAGVTAYVIDTGIDPTHPEFGGRAVVGYDALGGNGLDCNGHGTHVAGIVGAKTYGAAKQVKLSGVRVLGCNGAGTWADVIEGIDWVRTNSPGPAVANISIGGPSNASANTAVNNLSASGVFVAVAAGASASDACNFSPAGASGAFAVAATDRNDVGASFNNFGPCVKLCAPGVQILSTLPGGGTATFSGSSMSAAHVTGVSAMYKARFGDQPSPTVANWLVSVATPITSNGCSPHRLLYTNLI
jgi:subtilisin family serine protease